RHGACRARRARTARRHRHRHADDAVADLGGDSASVGQEVTSRSPGSSMREQQMPAYVHVNLRVLDAARQASIAPRFRAALEEAGGRIVHFGPVAQVLEGDAPLPMAGIFEFPTLAAALSFYTSEKYAPLKAERRLPQ